MAGSLDRYQLATNGALLLFGGWEPGFLFNLQVFMFFMSWFNRNGASLDSAKHFNFFMVICSVAYAVLATMGGPTMTGDARLMALSWGNVFFHWVGMA